MRLTVVSRDGILMTRESGTSLTSMPKNVIAFDPDAQGFVLATLDKGIDNDGYVVEKSDSQQRVLTRDGDCVEADRLAAVKKGSFLFFKADLPSLISLSDELE